MTKTNKMKTSTKMLSIGIASLFAIILFFGFSLRTAIATGIKNNIPQNLERIDLNKIDLKGIHKIETNGSWNVTIKQSTTPSFELQSDKNILENVEISRTGDTLVLRTVDHLFFGSLHPRATISLSAFDSLETSGSSKAAIEGFRGKTLTIDCSGSSNITGTNNSFELLSLDSSGASKIDFSQSQFHGANIDASGASKIVLNLTGGDLTGEASGAVSITYSGTTKNVAVHTSGAVNISSI